MVVVSYCALVASGLSERGKWAGRGQRGLTGGGGCIAGCEQSHDRVTGRGFPKTWGYSNLCAGMPPKPAKKPCNSSSGVDRHRCAAFRGCGGGPPTPFHAQHPPIASCPPNIPPMPSHSPNTPPMPSHPPNTPPTLFHPPNTPLMPSLPPNIPPMLSFLLTSHSHRSILRTLHPRGSGVWNGHWQLGWG